MNRIDRALAILLLLTGGGRVSAPELARRFGVCVRTIYRDVDALALVGVPVYAERGVGGGFRLQEGYVLPPVMFTREELAGLVLALTLLRSLRSVPLADELDTAEKKLLAALPRHLRPLMVEARRRFGFERTVPDVFHAEPRAGGTGDEGQTLSRFVRALLDSRRVRMTYRSPYRPREAEYDTAPLGLLWDRGHWYLVGRLGDCPDSRLWRADRVLSMQSGLRTTPDTGFDIRALMDHAWLAEAMRDWSRSSLVRLRVTARQAARLRQDWYYRHADYADEASGSVLVSWGEDTCDSVLALLRWLGPGAELVEPAAWRERLREELRAMLEANG